MTKEGYVYKLVSLNSDKEYIGSTFQSLTKRLIGHRCTYKQYLTGKRKHCVSSFEVLEDGDVDIVLLEVVPNTTKKELEEREKFYIQSNQCVNKNVPRRTREEWIEDNKERCAQSKKEWRVKNLEKMKELDRKRWIENKEHIKAVKCLWFKKNKEKIIERKKKYYEQNREYFSTIQKMNNCMKKVSSFKSPDLTQRTFSIEGPLICLC